MCFFFFYLAKQTKTQTKIYSYNSLLDVESVARDSVEPSTPFLPSMWDGWMDGNNPLQPHHPWILSTSCLKLQHDCPLD